MKFTEKEIKKLNSEFKTSSPQEILAWVSENLASSAALSTSFQIQGMALLDMFVKIDPNARVFTLDTGRLPSETYRIMDKTRDTYGIGIEVIFPRKEEVEEMVANYGVNLFYKSRENRRRCCKIRKTNPLTEHLKTLNCWITSIRKDQTEQRSGARKFEIDYLHGKILKVNPLLDWSEDQVRDYIEENKVPYNELHDRGYPSIGCAPCTRAVKEGEDPRAGRWWWEQGTDKECGLHYNPIPDSK